MAKNHAIEAAKAVIFDFDDTLVGTKTAKWQQHKYIAKTYYDKELEDKEIALHYGKPLGELLGYLYSTDDINQALAHVTTHRDEFPKELFPETLHLLRNLKAAHKLIGIVTATTRSNIEHDFELHDLPMDSIDYLQTADDTPHHKPDPRVFTPLIQWLDQRHVTPEETVYVGDGLHDFRAARDAGFCFIGVETGLTTAAQFVENGAVSVGSIADLTT